MSYHFVSSINSLIKLNSTPEPITVYLNSPGGDIYDLFQMIDYMYFIYNKYNIKIDIYGGGKILSAAAFLLIASTGKRYLFKSRIKI
jgi:ATP-dependent protease ClpP protease subunit